MMRDVTLMTLIMRNLTDLFRFLASRRRSLRSGAMPQDRMNREEFFAKVAPLDAEQTGNGASGRRTSHGGTSCCLVTSMRERAERLANHPAFEGPDADFLRARAARRRGDIDAARTLIETCLERLPGSQQFAEFAEEVGAVLPPRAREMRAERAAVQAQLAQAYQAGRISSD